MQSMRSLRSDLELGCVLNLGPCIPCTNKKDDIDASKIYDMYWNRIFLDPMYKGEYPKDFLKQIDKLSLIHI